MIEFAGEDDFRSIGLRPMEYRPAIIRRAMTRSALPLVQMHLQRPDVGVERRLSHVITLGYHLLDPRRRADSLQRMMLGRVHPQLSDEAVRIAQAKGSPLMLADDNDDVDTLLARGRGLLVVSPLSGASKGPAAHQISHAHFTSAEGTPWDNALQSHDLSVDRPAYPWLGKANQLHRHIADRPRRFVAAASVMLAAMFWFAWPTGSMPEPELVPSSVTLTDAPKVDAAEPVKPMPQVDPIRTTEIVTPVRPASITSQPELSSSSSISTEKSPTGTSATVTGPTVAPSVDDAIHAFDSLANDVSVTASAVASLFPDFNQPSDLDAELTIPALDGIPDISELTPVPTPWQKSDALKQLRLSVASQMRKGQFTELDASIVNFSSAHLVVPPLVAAEALTEDLSPLPFEDQYASQISYLTRWAGRAILIGDLSTAKRFLITAHARAKQAESDSLVAEVHEWQKTLDTMSRLGETTEHVDLETLTPVQKYAVGRYWALVCRNWEKGLPFLCSSSDPLVSKLAVQETLLGPDTTLAELLSLSEAYVSLAEKNKGWLHDSYVLHADQVLLYAHDDLSSSEQLQLNRYQSDLVKRFGDVFDQANQLKFKPKD